MVTGDQILRPTFKLIKIFKNYSLPDVPQHPTVVYFKKSVVGHDVVCGSRFFISQENIRKPELLEVITMHDYGTLAGTDSCVLPRFSVVHDETVILQTINPFVEVLILLILVSIVLYLGNKIN